MHLEILVSNLSNLKIWQEFREFTKVFWLLGPSPVFARWKPFQQPCHVEHSNLPKVLSLGVFSFTMNKWNHLHCPVVHPVVPELHPDVITHFMSNLDDSWLHCHSTQLPLNSNIDKWDYKVTTKKIEHIMYQNKWMKSNWT
jgi:hypothetical protein